MRTSYITTGVIIGAVLIVAGAAVFFGKGNTATAGKYNEFAACLQDKGAVFYGAFWCPHCRNQKEMFGDSADRLPYVECSTPDGKSQLPICVEKKITGYPTWEFADGSRLDGEIPLQTLAEKTRCPLPQ